MANALAPFLSNAAQAKAGQSEYDKWLELNKKAPVTRAPTYDGASNPNNTTTGKTDAYGNPLDAQGFVANPNTYASSEQNAQNEANGVKFSSSQYNPNDPGFINTSGFGVNNGGAYKPTPAPAPQTGGQEPFPWETGATPKLSGVTDGGTNPFGNQPQTGGQETRGFVAPPKFENVSPKPGEYGTAEYWEKNGPNFIPGPNGNFAPTTGDGPMAQGDYMTDEIRRRQGFPTQDFGKNPELNRALASMTGYTGDFSKGGFQQFMAQNPQLTRQYGIGQVGQPTPGYTGLQPTTSGSLAGGTNDDPFGTKTNPYSQYNKNAGGQPNTEYGQVASQGPSDAMFPPTAQGDQRPSNNASGGTQLTPEQESWFGSAFNKGKVMDNRTGALVDSTDGSATTINGAAFSPAQQENERQWIAQYKIDPKMWNASMQAAGTPPPPSFTAQLSKSQIGDYLQYDPTNGSAFRQDEQSGERYGNGFVNGQNGGVVDPSRPGTNMWGSTGEQTAKTQYTNQEEMRRRQGLSPQQNFGKNEEKNRAIAAATGYQGNFGNGEYEAWAAQNPEAAARYKPGQTGGTDPGEYNELPFKIPGNNRNPGRSPYFPGPPDNGGPRNQIPGITGSGSNYSNNRFSQMFTPPPPGFQQYSAQPFDYKADPGAAFREAQGNKALQARQLASGDFFSGGAMKELADYNSGLASQEYGNAFNRYIQQDQMGYRDNQANNAGRMNDWAANDAAQFRNDSTNYQRGETADNKDYARWSDDYLRGKVSNDTEYQRFVDDYGRNVNADNTNWNRLQYLDETGLRAAGASGQSGNNSANAIAQLLQQGGVAGANGTTGQNNAWISMLTNALYGLGK